MGPRAGLDDAFTREQKKKDLFLPRGKSWLSDQACDVIIALNYTGFDCLFHLILPISPVYLATSKNQFMLSMLAQTVKLLTLIWDMPSSNLDREIGYTGRFSVYSFEYNQQDATLYNILYYCRCCTCFRRFLPPSSGAQKLYTQHRVYVKLACCYR